METRIIGIDYGTSTSVVRIHNIGKSNKIVNLAINGKTVVPTIAFESEESHQIYFGYDAEAKLNANTPGKLFANFKMDLISPNDTARQLAEKLTKGFFKYLYEQYQKQVNLNAFDHADFVKVYISHPAKWNSHARILMKECVSEAGFCKTEDIKLKDEPTAAILAMINERYDTLKQQGMLFEGKEYKSMMIDMGAGTTDIVLFTYKIEDSKIHIHNIFTYPSTSHPALCGGREIDNAILESAGIFIDRMQSKPSESGRKCLLKLKRRIRTWKEQTIAAFLKENRSIPEPGEISDFRCILQEFGIPVLNTEERFTICRNSFETMTIKHWQQWVKLLHDTFLEIQKPQYEALECCKSPSEVELLLITGGHSQWYICKEFLLGKTNSIGLEHLNFTKIQSNPKNLLQSNNPQETVAVGLCYLDDEIVAALPTANDISIRFECEGSYLGTIDLVKKGLPLPYKKDSSTIYSSITGGFLLKRRKELQIDYCIITDSCNKIYKSISIPAESLFDILLRVVRDAFSIRKLLKNALSDNIFDRSEFETLKKRVNSCKYSVVLSPNIFINEEGIITIDGHIVVDMEKVNLPKLDL